MQLYGAMIFVATTFARQPVYNAMQVTHTKTEYVCEVNLLWPSNEQTKENLWGEISNYKEILSLYSFIESNIKHLKHKNTT